MGSSISDDEECVFFDAFENIGQLPDFVSNKLSSRIDNCVTSSCQYDVWTRSPASVKERRREFFSWMALHVNVGEDPVDVYGSSDSGCEIERITESSEAVVRTTILEDEFPSHQVPVPGLSVGVSGSYKELDSNEAFVCRNGSPDSGSETHELKDSYMSPVIQQRGQREFEVNGDAGRKLNVVKRRLLSRLRTLTCIVNGRGRSDDLESDSSSTVQRSRGQRAKVHHRKKRLKELSALFVGQDIQAHEGSILTMKFSLDGQYLASAGEDKIVRVWQVVEDERSNEIDILDLDPSSMYFTVNHRSQLAPLVTEKERINKLRGLKKTTGSSSCVIFPPKVFRILEEPLHVFQGHSGDILDVSWSNNNYLLSSSTDKTVRLWKVGYDKCLKVFSHSNYVTCVQFNQVNDEYFISGSIDGKVRIWAINSGQVVTWTDIKDIVTAISYRPDGKGGIIGSIAGTCYFFSLIEHDIHLEEQIFLGSKKRSLCKRITGFQFLPQDPSKVIVTCADSQVRILSGIDVIGKYRGLRNEGSHLSAAFSSDGKHIISASDDSNVYLWNFNISEESSVSQPEAVRSFEFFYSDASIAIPWSGLKNFNDGNQCHSQGLSQSLNNFPFQASPCFSLEAIPKGSATWPEEKLPLSSPRSAMCKSQYKFLKSSCQSSSSSHTWGLVIVAAGYDGRIRSYHNYGLPSPL